ncbi:MAG: PP2C family protein-serine/threonine phosphatase, partial [Candidatus Promineifilaceae bacterium]
YYRPITTSFTRHLNDAIFNANANAHELSKFKNASTTLVGGVIKDGQLHVFNVGDSRAYLLRDGSIQQLTEDHTFGTRLIRYLVATRDADPDIFKPLTLEFGDRILICSDGLYKAIPDEYEMMQLALRGSAESATRNLVQRANDNGGRDNITVILARIHAQQPVLSSWQPRYESI